MINNARVTGLEYTSLLAVGVLVVLSMVRVR
jgi:hypothetical protein